MTPFFFQEVRPWWQRLHIPRWATLRGLQQRRETEPRGGRRTYQHVWQKCRWTTFLGGVCRLLQVRQRSNRIQHDHTRRGGKQWSRHMNVTSTVKIRSDLFNRPINFTVIFLKMTMSVGSCCSLARDHIACENIRFSSLFAAGDVSRGGTSATQRQKFHILMTKINVYIINPVVMGLQI